MTFDLSQEVFPTLRVANGECQQRVGGWVSVSMEGLRVSVYVVGLVGRCLCWGVSGGCLCWRVSVLTEAVCLCPLVDAVIKH